MPGLILNRWVIAAVVAALLLAGAFWKGYSSGARNVEARWAIERADQARQYAEAVNRARLAEQAVQETADRVNREKADAINRLQRDHRAALDRLRDRPTRAPALPPAAGDAERRRACTGADLSREDAEFLVGEAARADRLRDELRACHGQYGAARKMTNR